MDVLNGIRVIDFGQYVAGPLAAGLLADYGADVVRVDPPGGPSFHTPGNATWNRAKRSIVLDLKNAGENDIARRLIEQADVVVENFRPGVMERLGLGPDVMLAANPRLVYCSIPGFAVDDPRAGIAAWEGVVAAATNTYRVPPEGSAPPTFTPLTIASNFAALLAATAIVAALMARERDGLGKRIEVPLFSAMFTAMGTFTLLPPTQIPLDAPPRAFDPYGGGLYRCADGQWVLFSTFRYRFLEWFVREAGLDTLREEGLLDPHWSLATSDRLRARLTEIFATRPAQEWEEIGHRADVPMSRVRMPREWLETEHALVSGIIAQVDDPEYGPMRVPGAPVRLARTPAVLKPRHTLDADRDTVLAELHGKQQDEGIPAGNAQLGAALAGMRVLDLTHMWAGPAAARLLAEFGAEVIKITDPDDAHFTERFHIDVNRGKRTVLLNLQTHEGMEVFTRLVKRADAVIHNFAYGAADRLGIGYEALRHLRPDIVYASISSCGSAGPWRTRRGYEPHGSALTGLMEGVVPVAPPFPVNDWGTGVLGAFAVLLALFHRLRTGEGQEVEASLVQTATWHQTPFLYQYDGVRGDERRGRYVLGWSPLQRLYRASDEWFFLGASEGDLPRLETVPELAGISRQRGEGLESFLEERLARDAARQKPYPPIWVAAMGPKSVARAAAAGYNSLAGPRPGYVQQYQAALREAGHDPDTVQVSAGPLWIHLAKTREQAWDEAEEGIHWTFEFYRRYNGPQSTPMMIGLPEVPPIGELRRDPMRGPLIVGTPDDALAFLEMFRGSGLRQIPFDFHHPGQPTSVVRRSMELFAEEVLPVLKTF